MHLVLLIGILATSAECRSQETLGDALMRIHSEYLATATSPTVSRWVSFDTELRHLLDRRPNRSNEITDTSPFREEYGAIGISINHYSGDLQYSGKLLADAHKINPHSSLRCYTLYSTANCDAEDCAIPNIDSAKQYVAEFPNGPYIFEVYVTLAHFYDDLYKELKRLIGGEEEDYKYDCYWPYIARESLKSQLTQARKTGLLYYGLAIKRRPTDRAIQGDRTRLQDGSTESWYFCED